MPRVFPLIISLALALLGCATPHDPEADRFSLETRAQERGRAGDEGLRIFARRRIGRETGAAAPDRFSPPRSGSTIPDTPAGRQLSWLLTQFNGPLAPHMAPHFTQEFLGRSSEAVIRGAVSQWKRDEFAGGAAEVHQVEEASLNRIGAVLRGRTTGRFSRIQVATDKWGQINSMSLTALMNFVPGALSQWSKIDAKLGGLPGSTSLAAWEVKDSGATPVHQFRAGEPMSINALAGLYVAGALTELVSAGGAKWDEPMPIADEFKSVMGGRMQLEASETEFPLSQYLSLMLAQNDTTAFDHLLLRVERPRVESYMSKWCSVPDRNRPFLATLEYYRIKLGADRTLPGRFAVADPDGRRSLLSESGAVDKSVPSLSAAANWRLPFEVNRIGWFASADDCCRVLADLARISAHQGMEPLAQALRMTGTMEDSTVWRSAAFKSGSEPGIMAMIWLLERNDGRRFVLALIANDPVRPISQSDLNECVVAAASLLGRVESKK
jgi:hypothetical protein